ncbi:MAG: aldo/keto reductase [Tepidibacter sp.]|jgi:predicted aldo/keto reductase-like oxidoreductase|uniref:aldo/keto reductase n=1 Tax=Tepidibacter sp. TaxID=2529387 RepID=UPI0025D1FBFD|nr:aldo/keto reductase [Tepidibacter sp.]MCT4509630.1 aldo/keto reductase [Tepidibacter sp.]
MLYRKFGKTNEKVSALGFGCMRFPIIDGKSNQINEEEAIKQIRYAIDNGVNYIDTAYPYHEGMSEIVTGKALKDGYREKVFLATKLPSWLIKSREDMDKYLNEQLKKLDTEYIDFYLVHTLTKNLWSSLKEHDIFDFLDTIVKDGRVKHVGFSFHDELPLFKEIVDAYNWEFCQIQYNFMDENYQAGKEGLKYASDKGLGVAIMEPLRGGSLAGNVPDDIQEVWNKADTKRTPAEWALKFLWNQPEVSVVLSGMNDMNHINENIKTANDTHENSLTQKEEELIDEAKNIYLNRMVVNCTDCKYCMPCPAGVNIPRNFEVLNGASMYNNVEHFKWIYNNFVGGKEKALNCVECGKCEKACPQHIKIIDNLKRTTELFE